MKFHSTKNSCSAVTASEAVRAGLASDGGLFVPDSFPVLDSYVLQPDITYMERAIRVLKPFFGGDPAELRIEEICSEAFNFPVPLRWLDDKQAVLELFHGPTLAFKDFGARFLSEFLEKTCPEGMSPLTVLVATSGDTGGAVAAAFHKKRCATVRVFFPQSGVSDRQRAQLTCWGENVTSYSVQGTFDDCQSLVKHAFTIPGLSEKMGLTSANSINLGRLLPQTVYYVHSTVLFRERTGVAPYIVVPTGNVGNVTAAFWAKKMGAPIAGIILAVNANRTIPDYLETGLYNKRKSVATLANAMDVGHPSNMERLINLFPTFEEIRNEVKAFSVSDDQIKETIRRCYEETGEILCPHTAVAERVRGEQLPGMPSIVVATAHPAKFETIVEPLIGKPLEIPASLAEMLKRPRHEISITPDTNLVGLVQSDKVA
ncbi:MAG: threonine synthase [Candidatus Riflebacteria bacterium]|nr:threonine synthase [Candidatus Riflebacteria bacterium]